jgi:hypothetical protein
LRLLKQFVKGYLIGVALVITVFLLALVAHCSVGKSTKTCFLPEGCVTQYTENPYEYNVGSILGVANVDGNLSIRFSPLGTYALYDEQILLCGFPSDKFEGVTEPLVLTYKRQASHLVNGIGCHDLLRVDNLTLNTRFK